MEDKVKLKGLHKRFRVIGLVSLLVAIITTLATLFVLSANNNRDRLAAIYKNGIALIGEGNYQDGIDMLYQLGNYKDSIERIEDARYWIQFVNAKNLFESQKYNEAKSEFEKLSSVASFTGVGDAQEYIVRIDKILEEQERQLQEKEKEEAELRERNRLYSKAIEYFQCAEYRKALDVFEKLGDFQESKEHAKKCRQAIRRLMLSTTLSAGINASAGITEGGRIAFSGRTVLTPEDVKDWSEIVSISIKGSYAIGLKIDGSVVLGGSTDYRLDTSTWENIVAVSAGDLYVVGLKEDGTVLAMGHNGDHQVEIENWKNIVSISTGWRLTAGIDIDGKVHLAGIDAKKKQDEISKNEGMWSDLVAISAGGGKTSGPGIWGHVVALRRDGHVVAVGDNDCGQCNVSWEKNPEWSDIIAISAGAYHTVGLKKDGTVVTTQTGYVAEQIKEWKNIVAVSAGYGFTLGLQSDGTVVGAGFNADGQRETEDWDPVVSRDEWELLFS